MAETYNAKEAYEAQRAYCQAHGSPVFAPSGTCHRCYKGIYRVGGISVEKAGQSVITSCPFCRASFCD